VEPRWIELDGTVNTRDLGGLPLVGGGSTRAGVLIRSDNLQALTEADVHRLVDELDVRDVVDLRTDVEVKSEGPGPITREPLVAVHHLSLFPEAGQNTDIGATEDDDAPVVLPWQNQERNGQGVAGVYRRYLDDRSDSVIESLRVIANSDGATIVHCAAGKDRTGTVIALALAEVGVEPDAIVADYAVTAERITAIMSRLRGSNTYADDLAKMDAKFDGDPIDRHTPRDAGMQRFLDGLTTEGGAAAWLRAHGWTEDDAAALRAKLVG
jgi:protein-tyrosine phosphatase